MKATNHQFHNKKTYDKGNKKLREKSLIQKYLKQQKTKICLTIKKWKNKYNL